MKDESPIKRPTNLTVSSPVHYVAGDRGLGSCEDIRDRPMGALWDGPEGFTNTHMAGHRDDETNFRFTMKLRFVTCEKCLTAMSPGVDGG